MLKNKLILFILFFGIFSNIYSQEILNQKISISKNDYKIGDLLKNIEKTSNVKFSYNSEIINTEKTIAYQCDNKKIIDCLNEIFENKLRYQVSGKYIILLKKTLPDEKKLPKQKISIFGTIINLENNQTLSEASVYDLDKNYSTISNRDGEFNITINSNQEFRGLTIGKQGFYDTVIIINSNNLDKINIGLRPKEIKIQENKIIEEPIASIKPLENYNIGIEKVKATEIFIPKSTLNNSKNLEFIDMTRLAQVSFLPGLSSNLSNFGVVKNKISFNILIGYSKGVEGFELAGLMNFDKENVNGLQIAGISNTIGGELVGLQIGGISNVVLNNMNAIQVSGISNLVKGNAKGIQYSGIFNTTVGNFEGFQLAGISNLTTKHFKGLQVAGIFNLNTGKIDGIQTAGIFNFSYKKIKGAQISGIMNVALDTIEGTQITGCLNIANINNLQISGLLNIAKNNKGFQIAPFNICDTSSGVSLGLVSYVSKGYHTFIFSSNELFSKNIRFNTGTEKFYNIFAISYKSAKDSLFGFSYGFGHKIGFTKKLKLSLELTASNIFYKKSINNQAFNIYKFSTILEYPIYRKIKIYSGLSFNFYSENKITDKLTSDYIINQNFITLFQNSSNNKIFNSWLGFSAGISF